MPVSRRIQKLNTAVGMSLAVIFVMVISSAVTYPLNTFLDNHGLGYLQTIVFILVIAALVQLIEITLKNIFRRFIRRSAYIFRL